MLLPLFEGGRFGKCGAGSPHEARAGPENAAGILIVVHTVLTFGRDRVSADPSFVLTAFGGFGKQRYSKSLSKHQGLPGYGIGIAKLVQVCIYQY